MDESSLAKAIDRLATKRAKNILDTVRKSLDNALNPHWRPKDANKESIREDIRALMKAYVAGIGAGPGTIYPGPSLDLINACRAQVLSELLNGLPKLGELVQMAEQPDYEQ